jgi:hypothetical protein
MHTIEERARLAAGEQLVFLIFGKMKLFSETIYRVADTTFLAVRSQFQQRQHQR